MNYYKELLSAVAIALTLVAFIPYIYSIRRGRINPHVLSWIIWGVTTIIVFGAQLQDRGGVGAWPIGISGVITLYVAFLAYLRRGDITVTNADWMFFVTAILSLPLWYITSDPLWAVILLTIVELLGFFPTIIKSYNHPFHESLLFFALVIIRNIMAIIALENYSVTTILFPLAVALSCVLLILIIIFRRIRIGALSRNDE